MTRNFRAFWRVKLATIPVAHVLFFAGYFLLLKNPRFPVTVLPFTAVDRVIGFHPSALLLYISLWLYISIAAGSLERARDLALFGVGAVTIALVGFAIFFFWPTAVPGFDPGSVPGGAMGLLAKVDAGGNACPSLHVAFAVFCGWWLDRALRRLARGSAVTRLLNALWVTGIIYSTIATRQHVAIDVAAGAILGAVVAAACLARVNPREHPRSEPLVADLRPR